MRKLLLWLCVPALVLGALAAADFEPAPAAEQQACSPLGANTAELIAGSGGACCVQFKAAATTTAVNAPGVQHAAVVPNPPARNVVSKHWRPLSQRPPPHFSFSPA
ncbi:MAG: hypothetical protein FJW20_24475 [Acidimicrobiia bacterium]|nr:hypothetical protein [Acidimicrobiia bacterium]